MRSYFDLPMLVLVALSAACASSGLGPASTKATVLPGGPGPMPQCTASGGDATGTAYFEFQVERPATLRARSPEPPRLYAEVLLQFIVDTAGRVDLTTVKVMKSERAAATRRLEKALPSLEFEPAIREGCRVRQVVQRPFY